MYYMMLRQESKILPPDQRPKHVAVIMDGNRRYAKKQGITYSQSYKQGADIFKSSVEWCIEYGIPYYTVYAFSRENWNRDKKEVDVLMNLFEEFLKQLVQLKEQEVEDGKKIRIKFIGGKDRFNDSIKLMMDDVEKRTANFTDITVHVAVDYSGKYDIANACYKLIKQQTQVNHPEDVIDLIENNLLTENAPPVDLVLRTGGDMRISNFLIWQIAYAEIVVCEEYWNEITKNLFFSYINRFKVQKRRFGK